MACILRLLNCVCINCLEIQEAVFRVKKTYRLFLFLNKCNYILYFQLIFTFGCILVSSRRGNSNFWIWVGWFLRIVRFVLEAWLQGWGSQDHRLSRRWRVGRCLLVSLSCSADSRIYHEDQCIRPWWKR